MKRLIMPIAAIAGLATAALVGVAIAKTFTLNVAANAPVMNGNTGASEGTANIAVTSKGKAVYMLSGNSKSNPKCDTQACWSFWPPLTVTSASALSKVSGIHGKLGVWNHKGFNQVTLGGHPLYRFHPDTKKDMATGDKIVSFGGTWHVIKAASSGNGMTGTTGTTNTMPTTTTTTTTTTTSCPPPYYPPYCP